MTTLDIAHVREQGVDMIIVPLDQSFDHKTAAQQNAARAEIQARAASAGLRGAVALVWDAGGGRMAFLAPTNWQRFFQSVNLRWVFANLNRELSW
jgi:hypothetical protein